MLDVTKMRSPFSDEENSEATNAEVQERRDAILKAAFDLADGSVTKVIPFSKMTENLKTYKPEELKNDTYYLAQKKFFSIEKDQAWSGDRFLVDIKITDKTIDYVNSIRKQV